MRVLSTIFVLTVAALLMLACDEDDPDTSTSSTPSDQPQTSNDVPLHDARLDLARRLDIDPADVTLVSIAEAGWDGCLGVREPDQPCTEQLIGGYLADFRASDATYRYHFGGNRFVFADPGKQLVDPMPVPPEIRPDLNRFLAGYARKDLELRLRAKPGEVVTTAIIPAGFPDGCMGFIQEGHDACDASIVNGAVVFLLGSDNKTYRYHVGSIGVLATDFLRGRLTYEPDAAIRVTQQLMREDLARRLQAPVQEISVVSYRRVTWADGCLGIHPPDAICSQALVDGFLALLTGPDGKEYRYHGSSGGIFKAASFETGARIDDPYLPPAP